MSIFSNSINQRFLKLICSEECDFLQENYPNAFLLLIRIAKTARRNSKGLDGLEIGDAIVGEIETPKKAGLSTKEYRNALEKLEELGFIETVFNPMIKTDVQKRAIKRAIKSKVVNIKDSRVLDINPELEGDQKGDLRATKGRPEGDKQEGISSSNNEKEQQTIPPNPQSERESSNVVCLDFSKNGGESPITEFKNSDFSEEMSDNICYVLDNKELDKNEKLNCQDKSKDISILDGLALDANQKKSLLKFPKDRIQLAIEFSRHETIKTSLIQLLTWHCKQPIPPISKNQIKSEKQVISNENSQIAMNFFNQCKTALRGKYYDWVTNNHSLKVGLKNRFEEISVYEQPNIFRERLESALRKYGMWVPVNTEECRNA